MPSLTAADMASRTGPKRWRPKAPPPPAAGGKAAAAGKRWRKPGKPGKPAAASGSKRASLYDHPRSKS